MGFEGYRPHAARLTDGRWTIGYSHTQSAREGAYVSEPDARILLTYDLMAVCKGVSELVHVPLGQNQFDALACFAFNVGLENFRRSSVLRLVNQGAMLEAAAGLEHWRRTEVDGGSLLVDGLVRRRAAEKALFLTPDDGWAPVPTPVIVPQLDDDHSAPIGALADLVVDLTGERAAAIRHDLTPPVDPAPVPSPAPDELEPFPTPSAPDAALEAASMEIDLGAVEASVARAFANDPVEQPPPEPQPARARSAIRAQFGEFEYATVEDDQGGYWPWVIMGLVGMLVFAISIYWALSNHRGGGLFSPQVIGTLLALAGVASVVCAVYSLIQRYLGRDD